MMERPSDLEEACLRVGARVPHWTQGAGGNLSLKVNQNGAAYLWIKSSGIRLDRVSEPGGLACVKLDPFLSETKKMPSVIDVAEKTYADLLAATALKQKGLGRPSMETGFHSLLKARWVMHFHSLAAILMASLYFRGERSWLPAVEADWGGPLVFLPALRPGWLLSQRLGEEGGKGQAFILQNHGLVLQGETVDLLGRWERTEAAFLKATEIPLSFSQGEKKWTGPLRLYFPDVAVFEKRLRTVLEPVEQQKFQLTPTAWEKDRDMAEIWVAVQLLHRAAPDLEEMPSLISSTVASLPTEKIRQEVSS